MSEDDERCANERVESHLYLVQHVVNQLASRYPRHIDRSELWSAGASGLVDASRRYDPETGVPFARYATIRIRGAIIDSTRTRDWATRSLRRDMRTLSEERASFEQAHGRAPTTEELAQRVGMTVDEIAGRESAAATANLLHLDQPLANDEGDEATFGERIPERDDQLLPDASLEHQELLGTVRTAIRFLPEIQREVVERYFFGGELLRDIADSLGVTEARVSQIRSEALNAVRAYFAEHFDAVPNVPAGAPGSRQRAHYVERVADGSDWRSRLTEGSPRDDAAQAEQDRTAADAIARG
ncbi:sigma-70 family RNA polymerase sigma factor [Egibacter rhizosphaerae]|uniref:sigma-70 family RNA polymerase sigma factor n=1 Tax=Egibacter rhizosphaerae TaxID=1670831 RepID=UPI0013F17A92|nr:sigma-70 family RNA polymerase sigma factor [Egibacter rhizosphaerae]